MDLFHKFKPEEACEKIAAKQEDHNLIVGWSHIGQRVWNYLRKKGESCVLLEKDPQKVEHLVNEEEPVITGSPVEMENLKKANIRKAKRVFVLVGDLVTETTVSHHTRSLNNTCELICRIFHDKVAEVLKKTYNIDYVISTSKYASENIIKEIEEEGYQNLLIFGENHISRRLEEELRRRQISFETKEVPTSNILQKIECTDRLAIKRQIA